jgi:hypothetical protein
MALEKEQTHGRVRVIGYGLVRETMPLDTPGVQTVGRLLHDLMQKVDALKSSGYQGKPIASSPHDTEILEGSTTASPTQTVQKGSTTSIDWSAKQQATPVDDITISLVGAIPSLEYYCFIHSILLCLKYFHVTQESRMCRRHVKVLKHDNKIVVANGLVQPKTEEEKIHFEDLPADMVRVEVTELIQSFFELSIHGSQILEYVTLGQ